VAIYIETCGGVDDHVAGVREQVAEHGLEYPVLDGEAGKIDDPTFERFRWAPHALVIERDGRVVETYGHMPSMKDLAEDLKALITTDRAEPRPGDAWRGFQPGAWVKIRYGVDEAPRTVTRTLRKLSPATVELAVVSVSDVRGERDSEKTISRKRPSVDPEERTTVVLPKQSLTIDGKTYACRVSEATWTRTTKSGKTFDYTETSWVAADRTLPERLLKRETTEKSPVRPEVKWTVAVRTFSDLRKVGEREVKCWVVDRTSEWGTGSTRVSRWLSATVPGREVRGEEVTVNHGSETRSSFEAVDFGAK